MRLRFSCSPSLVLALALAGCSAPSAPSGPRGGVEVPPVGARAPVLQRLTRDQYTHAIHDVLGDDIVVPTALEPDTELDGFFSVGAAEVAVSPRGVEQYERAAYAIAAQVMAPERRARVVTCAPSGPADLVCARDAARTLGLRAWRRPLTDAEVEQLAVVATNAGTVLADFHGGFEYAIALLLQSPDFVYRPSLGTPSTSAPGLADLDSYELATRLAFFLWNTTPDDELLEAAQTNALSSDEGFAAQLDRMLADPRAREGLRAFTDEWLSLHELDDLSKDPTIFTSAHPDLGAAARTETELAFAHHVLDLDADYRDFFVTRTTFVDRRLAALYEVPAPARDGFAMTVLPEDGPRRGLLGQASTLALHAHAVSTSPTLRGKFVREALLCQVVLPPPVDVNTALPEPDPTARTLRERLRVHQENPACAFCHARLDPIGLGLEGFDGIGRFRLRDEDVPIDASGELDGAVFSDGAELAEAVRDHPALTGCFVRRMVRYATGTVEGRASVDDADALTLRFASEGYRVRALMAEIARSASFRRTFTVALEDP